MNIQALIQFLSEILIYVRFEAFTVVKFSLLIFWIVALCGLHVYAEVS
jgi:hypothetical protein